MFVVIMLSYAVVQGVLLVESFRWANNSEWRIWFLRLLLVGMMYDNSLQAVGYLLIDQPWFVFINYPRYYLHVLVLPWLTLFTLSIMKESALKIASNGLFVGFCWLFTLCAVVFGAYHELLGLELAPTYPMGLTKLKSVSSSIPYATIATNFLVLLMAAAIWKSSGWRWLFAGALFILLVNSATGARPWGFAVGNFAEIVFAFSLLMTEKYFCHRLR